MRAEISAREVQPANIWLMSVTDEVFQPERAVASERLPQPQNMWLMSVILDVSQPERPGMDVRFLQPQNMYAMLVTSEMSRFVTSIVVAPTPSGQTLPHTVLLKRLLEFCGAFTPLAM